MRRLLRGFAVEVARSCCPHIFCTKSRRSPTRLLIISNGRIVASGAVDELLAKGGTLVRAREETRLSDVLERAGLVTRRAGGDGLVVDAQPEQVGAVASREGVALRELRVADRGGLEELSSS